LRPTHQNPHKTPVLPGLGLGESLAHHRGLEPCAEVSLNREASHAFIIGRGALIRYGSPSLPPGA
jgi:hypothetical protein